MQGFYTENNENLSVNSLVYRFSSLYDSVEVYKVLGFRYGNDTIVVKLIYPIELSKKLDQNNSNIAIVDVMSIKNFPENEDIEMWKLLYA